tara:strand:- start:1482 stop:1724 length:243 start_codon:yes stop_codon:yes gene_type:complete
MKDYISEMVNKSLTVKKGEVIYLFKDDLNKTPKTYDFDDVKLHSFRSSSITHDEICEAELIIYICKENYPRHKILKSRFF